MFFPQINNNNTSSVDNTDWINEQLDNQLDNGNITGNGVEKLGDQLVDLLHKFENETDENDDLGDDYYSKFYENYLKIIDTAMGEYWDLDPTRGISTNLKYLHNVDDLTQTISQKQIDGMLFSFSGRYLRNTVIINAIEGYINITDPSANITVRYNDINVMASGTIYGNRSVDTSNRYNTQLQSENDTNAAILSTTVEFTIFDKDFMDDFKSIEITFGESFGDDPVCVFWDEEIVRWSNEGCELKSHDGNTTVCQCDHLTNFGLIFGYGSVKCGDDDTKNHLSQILGGISIALLVFTQIYLHLGM